MIRKRRERWSMRGEVERFWCFYFSCKKEEDQDVKEQQKKIKKEKYGLKKYLRKDKKKTHLI